jgi:hypothetical protein
MAYLRPAQEPTWGTGDDDGTDNGTMAGARAICDLRRARSLDAGRAARVLD